MNKLPKFVLAGVYLQLVSCLESRKTEFRGPVQRIISVIIIFNYKSS